MYIEKMRIKKIKINCNVPVNKNWKTKSLASSSLQRRETVKVNERALRR